MKSNLTFNRKFALIYLGDNSIIAESDYQDYLKVLRSCLISQYGTMIQPHWLMVIKNKDKSED